MQPKHAALVGRSSLSVGCEYGPEGGQDCVIQKKKVQQRSRECHNHKPQPFPDTKRERKPTNPNKHKSNKRTKSTKISSLFPKRGNRNAKRTEKHKNKMTQVRHKTNRLVE